VSTGGGTGVWKKRSHCTKKGARAAAGGRLLVRSMELAGDQRSPASRGTGPDRLQDSQFFLNLSFLEVWENGCTTPPYF
jgi:hypothetical protein